MTVIFGGLTVEQLAFFNQQSYQIRKHNSTKQSKYWTERKKLPNTTGYVELLA